MNFEVGLQTYFVKAYKILLGGQESREELTKNAQILLNDAKQAQGLAHYVWSANEILCRLYKPFHNLPTIRKNSDFISNLKEYIQIPSNHVQQNGSLIVAAALRIPSLISEIVANNYENESIGPLSNLKKLFSETAAVWSTILLDNDSLEVLLQNGAIINNIGISKSSLLHWAVIAAQLDSSQQSLESAKRVIELLLDYGASRHFKNKIGKTPLDYAPDTLKLFLSRINSRQ